MKTVLTKNFIQSSFQGFRQNDEHHLWLFKQTTNQKINSKKQFADQLTRKIIIIGSQTK